jgi:two-component system sensor histidine kinase KdpD
LLLVGTSNGFDVSEDRLVSAAAAQIGLAYERARLRQEATDAEILRRTDELRTALLNAVSHDLRTPLATIMASAGSLRQQDVAWTEEERQSFAQAIEEEAGHLNHLVGNLLDLSRIEGGSLKPQMSWQELDVVIDDTVDRLRPVTRQHRLRVDLPHDLPPMWFDPVEIGEVLYNLVENASKYAPPDTDIGLTVARGPREVSVAVEDRGPGIPAAALPHLFDPFYRASDGRPRPQGLGLGLAIVKGLVEAHGGRVWAENRAGGGARFTFTLPVSSAPPELAANPAQGKAHA